MINPFQIEFSVRQHTPIIHFQSDQEGATLRISELKPAFDRYLWEKVLKKDFSNFKNYIVGYLPNREATLLQEFKKENWALDYRVTIEHVNPVITPLTNRFPCFFADLGDSNQQRCLSYIDKDFKITFTCFHESLRESIKTYFHDFLRTKNFGLRQSKGFGSFTSLLTDKATKEKYPVVPVSLCYRFIVTDHNIRNLFYNIELFWKIVRSGYNKPVRDKNTNIYIKSPLFFYLRDRWRRDINYDKYPQYKNIDSGSTQLEKRTIKQTYFNQKLKQQQQKHNFPAMLDNYPVKSSSNGYFLFRDLFGLSSSSQWLGYIPTTITKVHINSFKEDTIERFSSPVIIKPIKTALGFDVFICCTPIPENFSSQKFKILAGDQNKLTLETPPRGSFLFSKYFQFIVDEFKWKISPNGEDISSPDPAVVTLADTDDSDWRKIVKIFSSFNKVY